MFIYLQSCKNPEIRFEVVGFDADTGIGKLRGLYGAEFSRDISRPQLEKLGYKIVKSETPLMQQTRPET